jgi:cyclohexanecarboxylate-CoA ligase
MNEPQVNDVPSVVNEAGFREALALRPPDSTVRRFRESQVWREGTVLDDLTRWRDESPEAIAIVAHQMGTGVERLTYRQYADHVERFAGALYELGVRPGQVVALQLPNRWQVNVLLLACARIGAVFAPIITSIRPRELERVLRRLQAGVFISIDRWDGFEHASALAEFAPRLPDLRHRVVLGDASDDEIDFVEHFQNVPWERTHATALGGLSADPDRVGLVLFTSGTTGEPKAALHTLNTLYAAYSAPTFEDGYGSADVFLSSAALTHIAGTGLSILVPLLVGGRTVLLDTWEPETVLDLMTENAVSLLGGVPVTLSALITEVRSRPTPLPALGTVVSFGTLTPGPLIEDVQSVFGLPLRTAWGMTETAGSCTFIRRDDPADWIAHSVGRPIPGVELDLRHEGGATAEQAARLFIRGAPVCLATVGRDSGEVTVIAEHDDGWYDTGDLAVPDGRGGIQLLGRAADRIGGAFMIPVNDVETALLGHPDIDDVALVGYPDGGGGELACAVIVTRTAPPSIADLRKYLDELGMTEWYQPSRVEAVPALPRNSMGKVRKELLRRWLQGGADPAALDTAAP